jgi:hypothetical protein
MEDPDAPRSAAVTYAILSLVVRLIASQADVLSLWFSRRCYERSRGEMITMLYEKTLMRKIVGLREKPQTDEGTEVENPEGLTNGTAKHRDDSQGHPEAIWNRFRRYLTAPFRLKVSLSASGKVSDEIKEPASMGKILNLMR